LLGPLDSAEALRLVEQSARLATQIRVEAGSGPVRSLHNGHPTEMGLAQKFDGFSPPGRAYAVALGRRTV
jgi:hypothetical protein